MTQTAAERQANYRARRPFAGETGNGERRLSMWVNTAASLQLARLARLMRKGELRDALHAATSAEEFAVVLRRLEVP